MKCGNCKYCVPIINPDDEKTVGLVCTWCLKEENFDGVHICGADEEICEAYKEKKHD